MKCYICEKEGSNHQHTISGKPFIFCDNCEAAYVRTTKSLQDTRGEWWEEWRN